MIWWLKTLLGPTYSLLKLSTTYFYSYSPAYRNAIGYGEKLVHLIGTHFAEGRMVTETGRTNGEVRKRA